MLTLRGHHLICLHFFSGEGYDAPFIENLANVLKRAESEEIEISSTDDDICAKCSYLKGHKCMYDENADEEIMEMDETALRFLNLTSDQRTTWRVVKKLIPAVFHEWNDKYCFGCTWKPACDKNNFYREMKTR
jgi:hypothetical protein